MKALSDLLAYTFGVIVMTGLLHIAAIDNPSADIIWRAIRAGSYWLASR
jgi:hypothetical protein